jgi:hypothetical protein
VPVEQAIKEAFKAAHPTLPQDKVIIRQVREKLRQQGIEIQAGDSALRRRIQPHRKRARAGLYDPRRDLEEIPF